MLAPSSVAGRAMAHGWRHPRTGHLPVTVGRSSDHDARLLDLCGETVNAGMTLRCVACRAPKSRVGTVLSGGSHAIRRRNFRADVRGPKPAKPRPRVPGTETGYTATHFVPPRTVGPEAGRSDSPPYPPALKPSPIPPRKPAGPSTPPIFPAAPSRAQSPRSSPDPRTALGFRHPRPGRDAAPGARFSVSLSCWPWQAASC